MARAWLTPDSPLPGTKVYAVTLPDSDELRAVFYGAFLLLCDENNWEQFGSAAPSDVAALFEECWRAMYTTGAGMTEIP